MGGAVELTWPVGLQVGIQDYIGHFKTLNETEGRTNDDGPPPEASMAQASPPVRTNLAFKLVPRGPFATLFE